MHRGGLRRLGLPPHTRHNTRRQSTTAAWHTVFRFFRRAYRYSHPRYSHLHSPCMIIGGTCRLLDNTSEHRRHPLPWRLTTTSDCMKLVADSLLCGTAPPCRCRRLPTPKTGFPDVSILWKNENERCYERRSRTPPCLALVSSSRIVLVRTVSSSHTFSSATTMIQRSSMYVPNIMYLVDTPIRPILIGVRAVMTGEVK
jgi:hypothetical protein